MIPGLHHQISMKRLAASELARQAQRPACDPRIAYEKAIESERLALESDGLAAQVKENEQAMEGLLHLINILAQSKQKSRHRSLVITTMEDAFARLMLENGQPEPERKFEVIQPVQTNGKKAKEK